VPLPHGANAVRQEIIFSGTEKLESAEQITVLPVCLNLEAAEVAEIGCPSESVPQH